MCGITGFWDTSTELNTEKLRSIATDMSDAIIHRGPDSGGVWVDEATGIALGHRRLAIVDLSPEGHQPMVSSNNRYTIVFNGEVYNFVALREELLQLGYSFRGHSDTEIMLAAFSEWGLEPAVQKFNGMFAFALWDSQERLLHLGCDRLGEKPIYYGWIGQTLVFGSELKALKAHPIFQPEIDRQALTLFMRYSYVPAPYSIYQGIKKLPPATLLTWNGTATQPTPVPYWSVRAAAEAGIANPFSGSDREAIDKLDSLLLDAVGLRMMADVPLGAFLSGGVDSSTVVALMQAQSTKPVKTFSIGFEEAEYNEAQHAKAVAKHLNTEHTEMYVTAAEALAVIPKLPSLYDEPFADSSQIPTFLVSELARRHVTVSLSGDGGDELLGGYERYFLAENIWQKFGWMNKSLRQTTAKALTIVSTQTWDNVLGSLPAIPAKLKQYPGSRIHKLADILAVNDPEEMYLGLISHWQQPETLVIGGDEPPIHLTERPNWAEVPTFTDRMMYLDTMSYLPDDILVKVDRASMGVSLEGRIPLLDHRVVELAWQIPLSMKIRDNRGKWILRQVLEKYVPNSLIDRPKMGFGVPIDSWLRGPLKDWAEALLDENRLHSEGFFHPQPIRKMWAEHLSGDRNWQYCLWDVLMFQAWLEAN
ncbi:asparagine synthase (glutamine-hydrolyzing) [Chamaesiphon sp. VAR_48_metabat_135_sub]|uniref:asparagine synthase (glutamine-hydrolyzing) n=1 Tax=Chamaesiphon sp. VAR_48_metabat_135_sub TaxID=2964699 RepID=UPI00286A214C|nr:asparagine synthase (glutamine-hydrolyzing) [Chamaesiphon sp. VAR_48_metabat_135_sub]